VGARRYDGAGAAVALTRAAHASAVHAALAWASAAHAAPFRQPVNGAVVVSAYFDHGGRDWHCGDNTYGGHKGTDLAIIGRFAAQDEGRDVAAAQGGRVTRAHDGEFDRCTTADCGGGGGAGTPPSRPRRRRAPAPAGLPAAAATGEEESFACFFLLVVASPRRRRPRRGCRGSCCVQTQRFGGGGGVCGGR